MTSVFHQNDRLGERGAKPHLGHAWLQERGRPFVLGHRGASAHEPENTMPAFAAAMQAGGDGFELDARLTRCGELVVFHDEDLWRMCGDARRVSQLEWSELSRMRVGGQQIPRLRDVLEEFPGPLVNIELKKHPLSQALPLVQATLAAIAETRAISRVLVSSFDPRLLALLRLLEPKVPRALLSAREQGLLLRRGWLARGLGLVAVHPEEVMVSARSVARAHRRGYRVNTWTVDDPNRIRELASFAVDALICNDVGAALQALRA